MSFPVPDFTPSAIEAAKRHALASWPKESCGLIVAGAYVPCDNKAKDPTKDFMIDPAAIVAAGDNLQAVLHSHPGTGANINRAPSAADMQSQIDSGCIWGIIPCNKNEAFAPVYWGDFMLEESYGPDGAPRDKPGEKPHEALIGREFIHGVSDCGTLIRAWFWQQRGIRLPEFPRDDAWWKQGENIYLDVYRKAGFTLIGMKRAQPGDIVLGKVRSQVTNHGGVILDNGVVLHHLENRLSRREPIGPWIKYVTHWLRYEGKQLAEKP